MSSKAANQDKRNNPFPLPDKVTAVTVCQHNYLSHLAFELTIENGVVTSCKAINNAPDLMQIVAGQCSRRLWDFSKEQKSKEYKNEKP